MVSSCFISIDPGKKSGIAFFVDDSLAHSMALDIYDWGKVGLARALVERYMPQRVVAESTSWARTNHKQKTPEYHLGGLVFLLGLQNLPLSKVTPPQWRKKLFGSSKVGKQEAIDYVKEHFDKEVNDDEAEAICMGQWALSIQNELVAARSKG